MGQSSLTPSPPRDAQPLLTHLEGSDAQFEEYLVLGGDADGKHGEQHVVDSKERDEQQGGLGEPPAPQGGARAPEVTRRPPAGQPRGPLALTPPHPVWTECANAMKATTLPHKAAKLFQEILTSLPRMTLL